MLHCDLSIKHDIGFRLSLVLLHSYLWGSVATCMRCGGSSTQNFYANLLMSLYSECWKWMLHVRVFLCSLVESAMKYCFVFLVELWEANRHIHVADPLLNTAVFIERSDISLLVKQQMTDANVEKKEKETKNESYTEINNYKKWNEQRVFTKTKLTYGKDVTMSSKNTNHWGSSQVDVCETGSAAGFIYSWTVYYQQG